MKKYLLILISSLLCLGLVACGGEDDHDHDHDHDTIAVAGTWTSSFGGTEVITSTSWNGTPIVEFHNDENVAYIQNPADAQWGANQFSKLVWDGLTDDSVYYCTVDFGLATLADAKTSTQTADSSDPDNTGCGGFSWTKLSK